MQNHKGMILNCGYELPTVQYFRLPLQLQIVILVCYAVIGH
jgi:hypothetical protein